MPKFETPEPISVLLDIYSGYVQIIASAARHALVLQGR